MSDLDPAGKPKRPCDACRKKKSKCVFEKDKTRCVLCTFHDRVCEFNSPPVPKKRKKSEDPVKDTTTAHNYYLDGNGEFDEYIFTGLLEPQATELNPIGSDYVIRRKIHKLNNGLIMQVEGSSKETEFNSEYLRKINDAVGDCGPSLVSLYFSIVHSSFPILSESQFLKHYKEGLNVDPGLLSCLYLFAINWWSLSSELAGKILPSQVELETIAEVIIFEQFKAPTISTIQAGLLLIQHQSFRSEYENPSQCWPMQSALWGAAQCLGLNRDPSSWDLEPWEISLRKRLSWALYVQEKWFCISIDKSSHIVEHDWNVPDLSDEDFTEFLSSKPNRNVGAKIDKSRGKLLFIEKVKLTKIINVVMKQLCSFSSKEFFHSLEVLDPLKQLKSILLRIKPLQIQLNTWEAQMPESLLLESNVERGFISGAPNVYIAKFTSQITILRPVLRLVSKIKQQQFLVDQEFMQIRDVVFNRSISIFENILDFINSLKAEHFQTFWYTSARIGFSYTVLFGFFLTLISKNLTEYKKCREYLEDYIWKLKINNKNAEFFSQSILWWNQLDDLLTNIKHPQTFFNESLSVHRTGNDYLADDMLHTDLLEDIILQFNE